jgi:hypothetical protein
LELSTLAAAVVVLTEPTEAELLAALADLAVAEMVDMDKSNLLQ